MRLYKRKTDTVIFELLPQAIAAFKKSMIDPFLNDKNKYENERPPLRSELFTEEQLKLHAKAISKKHKLISGQPSEQLLKRLAENEEILLEVHAKLTKVVSRNERIVPAAEWLLDNFYLIEEQIYIAKKHFPKGYSKGLPQLAKGESAGLPRVYDMAVEIISHSDGHIDLDNLTGFINSYQTTTFLKLGELWAFPIMLRLALLENLRRLSIQIFIDISNISLADEWADKLVTTTETDPKNLVLVIADMARSEPPMESSFIAELTRRLMEKGNSLSLPLNWIEQQLLEHGFTRDEMILQENQKQAANQVSISNSISSLRFLGNTNWREFVESTSIVEEILRQDINGIYRKMDFHTRDQYRHSVERIAKYSGVPEQDIAVMAIQCAKEDNDKNVECRSSHVGFYLLGKGALKIQKQANMKVSVMEGCRKISNHFPLTVYVGTIFLLTFCMAWLLTVKAYGEGLRGWQLALLAMVCVFAISQLALSIVNWLATLLARPSVLPKMDFSKGIPDQYRSMVVIPAMLGDMAGINELIENLEVRFLANRDANLCFALLTDFKDADQQVLPDDKILLQSARNKIMELNRKYERSKNDTFFLFHRPRKWNKTEGKWMGYERKRGKLGELNNIILGKDEHDFLSIIGEEGVYSTVKFIITLDADTQLPREAAHKMVGTLAHPLNKAVFSAKKQRVVEGYTILQPRVANSLPGEEGSVYGKIHGNEPGTDPYTRAVSDVYQDLFDEGSFIGKGIYDVAEFERTLGNKFPENRILSHDLLEGSYARAGLISDVQLYEEYPFRYLEDMQRRTRWIRGDWQIGAWVLPWVKGQDRKFYKNPLSLLSKWKIFDNLRRSFVSITLLLLLIFGWLISPSTTYWTFTVTVIMLLPALMSLIWEIGDKPPDVLFSQHFNYTIKAAKDRFIQFFISIATLPFEAYSAAKAILITLWRIFISRRHLLLWSPFRNKKTESSILQFYSAMWFAPLFSAAIWIYLGVYSTFTMLMVFPFLILWFLSPFIVWFISKPAKSRLVVLSSVQKRNLRMLARKTWGFFENFVTAEDNWLPPDNYQEHPVERTAHRTSPTNMGIALLANLTAHDFGFITVGKFIERTTNTLRTMQRMEKYHGHLYNWYDTISLVPLAPKYVSTVDSGNLAGHLITLRQGLLGIADIKIISPNFFEGLIDTVNIVKERSTSGIAIPLLENYIKGVEDNYPAALDTLAGAKKYIDELESSFTQLLQEIDFNFDSEEYWWATKALEQLTETKQELASMCPWLVLPAAPEKFTELTPMFLSIATIKQIARIEQILLHKIIKYDTADNSRDEKDWLNNFRAVITESGRRAKEIFITVEQLALRCNELADIDYDFLYYRTQHLLTIGYNVDEHRRDSGTYDLMASEARLTTFTAIAQGKLPQESWFALGRQLTNVGATPILLSWSGSMFEYLMPLLVMPTYDNTLLDQSYKAIIHKQIEYGRKRNVPWGISESGYNMVDGNLNYQYKAFGVPGTGLKRGLGEDLVVSPYSTMMALMVEPDLAYENLQTLKESGFEGKFGFYEAIDYTSSRLQRRQRHVVIRSFMAHHQGMGLLSLSYLLLNKPMQQRFIADLGVKSALLLLQERIPRISTFYSPTLHASDTGVTSGTDMSMNICIESLRRFSSNASLSMMGNAHNSPSFRKVVV